MDGLESIITALQSQKEAIDRALQALREVSPGSEGHAPAKHSVSATANKPKRTLSASARKRIAKAQRERWAKVRAEAEAAAKKVAVKKKVAPAKKKAVKRTASTKKVRPAKRDVAKRVARKSPQAQTAAAVGMVG